MAEVDPIGRDGVENFIARIHDRVGYFGDQVIAAQPNISPRVVAFWAGMRAQEMAWQEMMHPTAVDGPVTEIKESWIE